MRLPVDGQRHFGWALTVNGHEPIPSRKIFGRRSLSAEILDDIIPGKTTLSGMNRMPIISVVALKGGTGKSTLCHMLAGSLGLTGQKILTIDADPQSSLSTGMLGTEAEQLSPDETVAAVYAGRDPLPSDIIRPSGIPGVDLIPGSQALNSFNMPDPHLASAETQGRLRSFLDEIRGDYAFVLIDSPPNLYAACYGSLVAADFCLVPVKPENYGVASVSPVLEVIRQVSEGPNPSLVNLGIVLTKIERTGVHVAFEKMLRDVHGPLIFESKIAKAADIPEAILVNKPVTHFRPRSASAKAFKSLADEIMARIAASPSRELEEVGTNGQG
jgi:chromosome partitioning protein